jgi:DNA repair exonuclease SbcCD ATPase subunit
MRYYRSTEEQQKDLNSRIESYRSAAALAPIVIKVLKTFDNKVYNCRLDKAIREATDNKIGVYNQYGFISIYATYTTNYHHINLATFRLEELENKRIDADKLIEQVKTARENLLKKAYQIETTAQQADNIREYIRQSIEKLESMCRDLPDDIREIYNIPYSIRTN